MSEPTWLRIEAVLAMHEDSIQSFGGASGTRDMGMLESALAKPQNIWAYEGPVSMPRLAASYAFGIVMNHPFVDGNKRTGFLAAYSFLHVNGFRLETSEVDATVTVLSLAAGELPEAAFAAWLTDRCVPLNRP